MKKRINIFILFVIFILAFLLRAQELISHNFLFLIDQGRDMMAVKSIIFDHHLTLIGPYTSLQGVFQGPLWYYLLSIPTFFLKGDPWGGIVLMFIISLSVVFISFFFTKKMFGEKAAIFTAFVFAISPEAIAAATYTWNPHPMWLLVILYIFIFYKALSKKYFHLFLWPIISLMFHFETALAVFILFATIIYFLIFERKKLFQKHFFYGVLIAGFFFLPQIIFDLRHNFLMTKSILSLFSGSKQGLLIKGESQNYFLLIQNHLSLFSYNFQTSFMRDGYLRFLPNIMFAIMIFSVFLNSKLSLFSQKENKFNLFLLKVVGIIVLLSFFYPFPLRYWFLTGFQSFYVLIFALFLSRMWSGFKGRFFVSILIAVFVFYSGLKIHTLYFNPPDEGGTAKIKGKTEAIDYVYNDSKRKEFNLLVFTPPVNTDAYDYLIFWYGKEKYGFIPSSKKSGTFYLLIEPDPEKPWSYKGWLETVIKDGKVLETKTLPSGFIIQKRITDEK
ncbi:MAG: glycosyltransferase family 39 protein [Candidatus Levybacteria bacterium]|nr:glycosyltransferase family 39 protein [Candidatus Levybacteria bacterium]